MEPTRARPVPFCRHGFLPLPLTFARFFVLCVPRRAAAFACTTDSHIRSAFTRPPNTSSRSSMLPIFAFSLLTTSSSMYPPRQQLVTWRVRELVSSIHQFTNSSIHQLFLALLRFLDL